VKRACILAASRKLLADRSAAVEAATRAGKAAPLPPVLKDVRLSDGTIALGYRDDSHSAAVRADSSWRVRMHPIPRAFSGFHDTMTGPPTPQFLELGLRSGARFFMADFEDSSTVALESLLDGMRFVTAANRRALDYTDRDGRRYRVTSVEEKASKQPFAEMSVRFEGLHLPNGHFLVDEHPIPAHIVTIALYLFHNWQPLAKVRRLRLCPFCIACGLL
jgi:malate synthase